jgi:hypothetical protein
MFSLIIVSEGFRPSTPDVICISSFFRATRRCPTQLLELLNRGLIKQNCQKNLVWELTRCFERSGRDSVWLRSYQSQDSRAEKNKTNDPFIGWLYDPCFTATEHWNICSNAVRANERFETMVAVLAGLAENTGLKQFTFCPNWPKPMQH